MAIWHFAYTFDSNQFHSELKTKIVHGDKIDLEHLQNSAKHLVKNASEEFMHIFLNLQYDDECLDDPDGDKSQACLWYTINLVSAFNNCPSLSNNRLHNSHRILELILPVAGWTDKEAHKLIFGKSLDTLLANTEYEIFLDELSLDGGCLSTKDIGEALSRLKKSRDYFFSVSDTRKVVEERFQYIKVTPSEALEMAYLDAVDMLETALSRDEALYLLRDF